MKKIIILLFLVVFTLSGCSKKDGFEISFDDFKINFNTNNTFKREELSATGIGSQIIKQDILKIYTKSNSTGYIDSIIFLKKLASKDLKDFVDENVEKLKIDGYKVISIKENKISCNNEKLDTYTITAEMKLNLNPIFFSHTFLIYNKNLYIISYATEQENEQQSFSESTNHIKCKK